MQYQSSWAPKLARKCEIEHWFPCAAAIQGKNVKTIFKRKNFDNSLSRVKFPTHFVYRVIFIWFTQIRFVKVRWNGEREMCNLICNINCWKNQLNSGLGRFTNHELDLSCNKLGCCRLRKYCVASSSTALQQICRRCPFYLPLANVCSKWRKSRVWRDSCVKLSNQKLVFTQLTCCKTGLIDC